jgi:hypothetical protein
MIKVRMSMLKELMLVVLFLSMAACLGLFGYDYKPESNERWSINAEPGIHGSGMFVNYSYPKSVMVWIPRALQEEYITAGHNSKVNIYCFWPNGDSTAFPLRRSWMTRGDCPVPAGFDISKERFCISIQLSNCTSNSPCKLFPRCSPLVIESLPSQRSNDSLAICSAFKDESHNLAEWIMYHHMLGVGHFYLYDNLSSDRRSLNKVLTPFLRMGIVTFVFWPERDVNRGWQPTSINDCIYRFGSRFRYMAHIDVDEFFVIKMPSQNAAKIGNLPAAVEEIFRSVNPEVWNIHVPWAIFGSSGHISTPGGLVLENYWKRMDSSNLIQYDKGYSYLRRYDDRRVSASKSVIRVGPHFFCASPNIHFFAPFDLSTHASFDQLHLNHYHTKSYEEWRIKRKKQYQSHHHAEIADLQWVRANQQYEQVTDISAMQFGPLVRKKLDQVAHLF